jgi:hypothetical protein
MDQVSAHLIEAVMFGQRYVQATAGWLVIVCPEESVEPSRLFLAGATPEDAKFAGRTARFQNGGSLSVVESGEDVFLPAERPFSVMFVGWGEADKSNMADMVRWKAAATQVVSKADHES